MEKIIVLCGGGTAGHVTPNLALLPYLQSSFSQIHYIGTGGIEKKLLQDYKFVTYHQIPAVKLRRSLNLKNLLIPFKLPHSISCAKKLLKEIKPSVIFSKGGYAALPVVLGAGKIPVISHESDYSLGLANKMAAKKSAVVCTSFSDTAKNLKNGLHTGSPIRAQLKSGNRSNLNLKDFKPCPTLLVMGGSLGAGAINEVVFNSLDRLLKKFNVIHITGAGKMRDITKAGYFAIEYTTHIEDFFAAADLVLTRGGANSLFEIAALKIPSIVIPLQKGSRGDQLLNARYFENLGACKVLNESELNEDTLRLTLESVLNDNNMKTALEQLQNIDGTKTIARLLNEYALKNKI